MSLDVVRDRIVSCQRCPRLREYCERVGREKRASFRDESYWAKPVPGFGDPRARVAVVGLAPAAHGANRTGRNFTGDGAGGSGDFLMTAMHAHGFANQPFSRGVDDGLELHDAWIAAAARCAPPDNKPTPAEVDNCREHLCDELAAIPTIRVYVGLGRIAFDACRRLIETRWGRFTTTPTFAHGAVARVVPHDPRAARAGSLAPLVRAADGPALIASYHPSRQNTHTGRLTPDMLSAVFATARQLVESSVDH
jgi:uracil-DNA glycosylase